MNRPHPVSQTELECLLQNTAIVLFMSNLNEFNETTLKNASWKLPEEFTNESSLTEITRALLPIITKKGKWSQFINIDTQVYLASQWIKNLNDKAKKDFFQTYRDYIGNELCDHSVELWEFLFEIDRSDFLKYCVVPQLKKFLEQLNFSTAKELILSYCKITEISSSYTIDESGYFTEVSASCSCAFEEDLINLLQLEYSWFNLGSSFSMDYIDATEFTSKKDGYLQLFAYIKNNCYKKSSEQYVLDMANEMQKSEFYKLIKAVGIEKQIVGEIKKLATKISELEAEIK
ncbi:MAG: family ATPase [Bacteroidetes bacterium]|nr:family ATPase [Bacteroidota bacterium]